MDFSGDVDVLDNTALHKTDSLQVLLWAILFLHHPSAVCDSAIWLLSGLCVPRCMKHDYVAVYCVPSVPSSATPLPLQKNMQQQFYPSSCACVAN